MNIILRCFAVTCLMLFSLSALGDHNRRSQAFLMFNAGTLNVNIMQFQLNDPATTEDDRIEPISIIDERSLGTFGRADLKTFSKVITNNEIPPIPVVPDPDECPDGFPIPVVITDDATVLTFRDLSQLVGKARTVVCLDYVGTQGVRSEGHWTGGTRRFANVTGGDFQISSTATPQSTNGQFYSTVGVVYGRLVRQ